MSASADIVSAGLLAPLADLGVDLESVEVQKAGRRHVVRVVVDRDGGVDLDLIARIDAIGDAVEAVEVCQERATPDVEVAADLFKRSEAEEVGEVEVAVDVEVAADLAEALKARKGRDRAVV